jgi:hypothetical protein
MLIPASCSFPRLVMLGLLFTYQYFRARLQTCPQPVKEATFRVKRGFNPLNRMETHLGKFPLTDANRGRREGAVLFLAVHSIAGVERYVSSCGQAEASSPVSVG